ncbi:hypothetical protein L0P14_24940, partial [Phocaeicola dorei]|uniref:hypothetical protein n=1 Tax=Phocaeicola dorei TaxID=357276 RepID=UPI001EDD0DB9
MLRTRAEVVDREIYEHSTEVTDVELVTTIVEKAQVIGTTPEALIESATEDRKEDEEESTS